MKNEGTAKISTESYKGVRDFYPAEQANQNYILKTWKNAVEKFGYQEYGASILESAELYRAKSGEEIVNEQTYTFKDRGEREVTLRPEMTPTVARMIAAKRKELSFPLRWYSTPNLFRYEKPQRGRLREHWQLNCDIFGIESIQAEVEIISVASEIMRSFGVKDSQFEIHINNRKIVNYVLHEAFAFPEETATKIAKLIDRKDKMEGGVFKEALQKLAGENTEEFLTLLNSKNFEEFTRRLGETASEHQGLVEVTQLMAALEKLGITNVVFDQTLMRGFDYYTGIVFEIFDQNPGNRRALFGGGRYDDLLAIFGEEKVPAVGFGMGDVTIRDVLETYGLLPIAHSSVNLSVCTLGQEYIGYAQELAQKLRAQNLSVIVDYSNKKIGDQIKRADKQNIPFIVAIGEEEVKNGKLKLKNLKTGEETDVTEETLASLLVK